MSMIHDAIKMKLSAEGYLPNYPYHMISDKEMCDAFINDDEICYFYTQYPCVAPHLEPEYNALVTSIKSEITKLITASDPMYKLPNWVYAYMLGTVVSVNSDTLDIHDLLVHLGVDNTDDIFTPEAAEACLKVSRAWLNKSSQLDRCPTIFGEPHVIKSLRLHEIDIIGE